MPKILIDKVKREEAETKITDWPEEYIRTVDLIKMFEVSRQKINIAMIEVGSSSPHEKNSVYLIADKIFGCIDEAEEDDELEKVRWSGEERRHNEERRQSERRFE